MSAAMTPPSSATAGKSEDAIALLTADHRAVKGLFGEFAQLKDEDGTETTKSALVKKICDALKIHTAIEEEIFYPAVRKAIDDAPLMDEALEEHTSAKELIAQLEEMDPADHAYDATVTELNEAIEHHVTEEEGDMFVKAKAAKVDVVSLGTAMAKRKTDLMADTQRTAGQPPARSR